MLARSLAVAVAILPAACGGDDDPVGDDSPDARVDGTPPDAPRPDATPPPPPDATPPEGEVLSNLPGLEWVATADSVPGIEIVSSNVVQENLGGSVYQHWYAEVRNAGSTTLCYPQVTLQLQDASGTTLVEMYSFADTAPYRSSSTLSTPCLAPGATGGLYDINSVASEAPLPQIRRASYTVEIVAIPTAVPHPLAPTMTGEVFERFTGYWAVKGTVRGGSGTIRNVSMDVYPVGPSGWIVDNLIDTNLGTITPGGAWAYETTSYDGARFTAYHQYVGFIEGAGVAAVAAEPAVDAADAAAARWRDDRDAQRDQRDKLRASLR